MSPKSLFNVTLKTAPCVLRPFSTMYIGLKSVVSNKISGLVITGLLFALSTACGRYAVSVNERTVYEPAPLFSDYSIADEALRSCVRDTIAEKQLTKAEQLKQLICPPGAIVQLSGIQVFSKLEHLGMASNQITDIAPLSKLLKLTRISLENNRVENFAPLQSLSGLLFLNAKGNENANCASIQKLNNGALEVVLPKSCE